MRWQFYLITVLLSLIAAPAIAVLSGLVYGVI
jgi:hypothetical protein